MDLNLNLNLLRVFHLAAQELNFSRAATVLHLTQPGVSKHIRSLEDHLQTRLFDRLGKTLALTRSGEELLAFTRTIFAGLEDVAARIGDLRQLQAGRLRVGASVTIGVYVILPYFQEFRSRYPQIEIALDIGLNQDIVEKILENTLDLGFLGAAPSSDKLQCAVFRQDELILVFSPAHPWSGREVVSRAELAAESFVMAQSGSGTRAVLEKHFHEAGLHPRVLELGHTESVKKAVENGLGVSIMSRVAVDRELAQGWLRTARLEGFEGKREMYYAYRQDKYLTQAARTFLSLF